jgi:argininosuccinate synthase
MTDTRRAARLQRIVFAHSGAIDTSVAIPWLAAEHGAEVIAVTVDLGQKKEWLEEMRDRALANGAVRAHVVDMRDEYARDYLIPGLRAGMLGVDPVSTAATLAGPLVAQTLVSLAQIEQTRAVAHGEPGGDAAPLARTVHAIDPALTLFAVPAAMATRHGESLVAPRAAGSLPAEAAFVDIAIDRGVPTGVNGVAMPWADLVGSLDIIARAHDVGPSPLVLLNVAHQALRKTVLADDAERFGDRVAAEYQRMLRDGSWFSAMRRALDSYVDVLQQGVGGIVRLKLSNGACTVVDCQLATAPAAPTIISLTKA